MSMKAAEEFRRALAGSAAIQEDVRVANRGEDLVAVGKRHGFVFTADEIQNALALAEEAGALSDLELDLVSGGLQSASLTASFGGILSARVFSRMG